MNGEDHGRARYGLAGRSNPYGFWFKDRACAIIEHYLDILYAASSNLTIDLNQGVLQDSSVPGIVPSLAPGRKSIPLSNTDLILQILSAIGAKNSIILSNQKRQKKILLNY